MTAVKLKQSINYRKKKQQLWFILGVGLGGLILSYQNYSLHAKINLVSLWDIRYFWSGCCTLLMMLWVQTHFCSFTGTIFITILLLGMKKTQKSFFQILMTLPFYHFQIWNPNLSQGKQIRKKSLFSRDESFKEVLISEH